MNSNIIFGQMIDYLRKQRNWSMEELGDALGKNKSTVSRWINGTRFPSIPEAESIAEYFDIPFEVLIFGAEGQENLLNVYFKLENSRQQKVYNFAEYQLEEQNKVVELNDYIEEEMYGYLSAGTGEYLSEDVRTTVQIPKDIIPDQKYDMILQVNGDSMTPMFEDKEYVFVRKIDNIEDIRSGQVGVFIIDGESYLKKAYIHDDHLRLVSLNPEYPDLTFDSMNEIQPVGTIVL